MFFSEYKMQTQTMTRFILPEIDLFQINYFTAHMLISDNRHWNGSLTLLIASNLRLALLKRNTTFTISILLVSCLMSLAYEQPIIIDLGDDKK